MQGSLLISALNRQAQRLGLELEIVALGGSRMAGAGAQLLGNTSSIGSVGIVESLPYILPTLQLQRRAKLYLEKNPPDLVILIDYMGPNLAIGNYICHQFPAVPIAYYIAPQEWVWSLSPRNTARIVNIADLLLAIFPEEASYFAKNGAKVSWVGHPLLDKIPGSRRDEARRELGISENEVAIALLPASRYQEIKYVLPVIFQAAQQIQAKISNVKFWIPLSLEVYRNAIEREIKKYDLRATLITDRTQEVLAAADLAITKSGTVNLEIALLEVPQVVVYRVNPITAWIARTILKFSIPFMSPPNLVQMKGIVPELLQEQASPENIAREALDLLDATKRNQIIADYREMRQALGQVGVCDRAAKEILLMLSESGT